VKAIERTGVEIAYGKALGRDFTLADLEREGFRAVFLAVGTQRATAIELEGDRAAEGVWDCLDFLARAKAGEAVPVGKTVLVLGGGNVAIDVARTARRLGAADVRIVYRRTRRQMRAHAWEIEEALEEGITVEERWAPKRIVASEGRVRGLEVRRSVLDAAKGVPGFDDSERKLFEADTVVFAIGVAVDPSFRRGVEGLELHPDGRVKADPLTLRTSVPGVFAGGDCVTGPNIAVQACAHGLVAALQIARYLATGEAAAPEESREWELLGQLRPYDPGEKVQLPRGDGRVAISALEMPERARGFREVERGFTAEEAVAEASRCLRCYRAVTCAYRA
jgi:NADPH-dependent glutamate synthase beta subunit-like oxidoreductase